MNVIRKKLTMLMAIVLLCNVVYIPVSAAELPGKDMSIVNMAVQSDDEMIPTVTNGSNYFTKTVQLASINGEYTSASLSSGSCLGITRSITKVTVSYRISSGNFGFNTTITSPDGTMLMLGLGSTSVTNTTTMFNGEDPQGTWNIGISSTNEETVSVTVTLKVYYDYE